MAGTDRPKALLRIHVQATAQAQRNQLMPITLVDPPQVIMVYKKPVLTEQDIASAETLPGGKALIIFSEKGKKALEQTTKNHAGAILAILCNNRLAYAPVIDVVLTDGRIIVPDGILPEEVDLFQKIARKNKD